MLERQDALDRWDGLALKCGTEGAGFKGEERSAHARTHTFTHTHTQYNTRQKICESFYEERFLSTVSDLAVDRLWSGTLAPHTKLPPIPRYFALPCPLLDGGACSFIGRKPEVRDMREGL